MASSNVQFYENQKKLQDVITKCEEQRMNLDQQLKKVFQSDQTTVKLKAAKLHSYWKRICEDERRAKQRNEMILREFQRIDTHMSELNARTQRLALMKKQYEDVILRKYPNWNDLMNGTSQSKQLNEGGDFVEVSSKQQHQNSEHITQSSFKAHKPSMPSFESQTVANENGSNQIENIWVAKVSEDSKKMTEQRKWHLEEQVKVDPKEKQEHISMYILNLNKYYSYFTNLVLHTIKKHVF
ncbi:hypothetical protein Btru_049333 [Bulinus truncatus]|nr:hypothetical protein Btru_049333 [Bulinus truncatus]